jgi:hypothetical protein
MRFENVSFWDQSGVCLLLLLEAQVLELGWTMTFAVLASFSSSDLAKREKGNRLRDGMGKNEKTYQGNGKKAYSEGNKRGFILAWQASFLPSTHTHHKTLQMNI